MSEIHEEFSAVDQAAKSKGQAIGTELSTDAAKAPQRAMDVLNDWLLKALFRRDGTYDFIDGEDAENGSQQGRFLYANGILLLIADDGQATFKLEWNDKDQFRASHGEVKLSFRR